MGSTGIEIRAQMRLKNGKNPRNSIKRELFWGIKTAREYARIKIDGLIRGVVSSPIVRLAKDPSGRADGRKQPVELLDTCRYAKASTKLGGPARPRPAPVAREAPSPTPL